MRVDEVELAIVPTELIERFERDVDEAAFCDVLRGHAQHRWRYVDSSHVADAQRERHDEPSRSAAELEHALRRQPRVEMREEILEQLAHLSFAGGEKRGGRVIVEIRGKVAIVREHRKVRFTFREA